MRTAICLADKPSTSYFCLRKPSFLYSGVVQRLEYNVIFGEDTKFALVTHWSTTLKSSAIHMAKNSSFIHLAGTLFWSHQSFGAGIPGVPNDLRREFKSVHKFIEKEISLNGEKIFARLDVDGKSPLLYYKIKRNQETAAIRNLVKKNLPMGIELGEAIAVENSLKQYPVIADGVEVEGAWVRVYQAAEEQIAIGLKVPASRKTIRFRGKPKASSTSKLVLLNSSIIEQREKPVAQGMEVSFPVESELPSRLQVEINATKDESASLTKVSVPEGTFPDQIVNDEVGNIWFTQPSDDLLTKLNPETMEWQQIPVGKSPDGLFLDSQGKLWFGEYSDHHMGMYDPQTEEYLRYEMPYEDSSPAIPYEDHDGLIWLTDHRSNKVSVLDLATNHWSVYSGPVENAWIVQLIQMETNNQDVFATHCYANAIGRIDYETREYRNIPLGVAGCPAFFAAVDETLYISQWTTGHYLTLNTETEEIAEFIMKHDSWNEAGIGPVTRDLEGNVYFASLSGGRVYKLNTANNELVYVEGVARTKDGIVVDAAGTVWVTEQNGTLAKIRFSR